MKVEFLADFSIKKKGDVCQLNKAVASSLIARKVAKLHKEVKEEKKVKQKKEE